MLDALDDRIGPPSGGFGRFRPRRGLHDPETCGRMGGGTGEVTIPGDIAISLAAGDKLP